MNPKKIEFESLMKKMSEMTSHVPALSEIILRTLGISLNERINVFTNLLKYLKDFPTISIDKFEVEDSRFASNKKFSITLKFECEYCHDITTQELHSLDPIYLGTYDGKPICQDCNQELYEPDRDWEGELEEEQGKVKDLEEQVDGLEGDIKEKESEKEDLTDEIEKMKEEESNKEEKEKDLDHLTNN